jgi:hypothetical protein
MNWISVVIIGFVLLEGSNVAALYFMPESKKANAMGVFRAWEQSKQDPAVHDLVRYLVNWVAGTKLMFLVLLVVILLTADAEGLFYTGIAMVIAISSFFWRLFPLARKMDREGQLDPAGYSSLLGLMIAGMLLIFLVAIVVTGNG